VGILVKKSLKFSLLDTAKDPASSNYLLLLAEVQDQTVILGSIYGPNNRDDNFFVNLSESLGNLGKHPAVLGGDWNSTFSRLPVQDNPDVMNMQDVPNAAHSRKIQELCSRFNLTDPFRVLFPNLLDFSYAPWNNIRKNRSRIDFFLMSKECVDKVNNCYIKPSVQSKLFDHKAIIVDFVAKPDLSSRPNISSRILRDSDIEIIVKLAAYECYSQNIEDGNIKNIALRLIGRGFKLVRQAGPDPKFSDYSYASLLDIDARDRIMFDIRNVMEDLERMNITGLAHNIEADTFLEYLLNNIRNEVISYQSFISKIVNQSLKKLVERITNLKENFVANFETISDLELKLCEINENKVNAILEKKQKF
jgi:hypothetical protein